MKNYISIMFCFVCITLAAQPISNFNSSRNWSQNKKEVYFGLGASNFIGDLGGQNSIGTDYSLTDMDFPATGFGLNFGYRYRWHPFWATSTDFYSGLLSGSDEYTNEVIRRSRNLHFRSPMIQLTQRVECILLSKERVGRRYRIAGIRGFRNKLSQFYLFTGVSVGYFNPQAKINDEWTNLRPLKTEGQGLEGGADEYMPVTAIIPFGFGVKFAISNMWRLGFELTYNKTFSDYIDDVSGTYYDPQILQAEIGSDAAFASNPSNENQSWFSTGQQRGDADQKDSFYTANLILTRNISYKGISARKRKYGRTKF